ncbi:MAG: IS200/IS605 family transposase [Anaerolineales bacterium]|nr:IS200/IS605 family transposase [Anaerolineales bacterium]
MPLPILVLTTDTPFGMLLRQSLEDGHRFAVRVVAQSESGVDFVREMQSPLAFLDVAQLDGDPVRIGEMLCQANDGIKLVLVSESGWQSLLQEMNPAGRLSKPYYLPDLLDMMDRLLPEDEQQVASESQENALGLDPADTAWMADVNLAAQHLTRLTLESSAQAALITRACDLWAYAGQLSQDAAREVASAVERYWDRQEQSDLVRFIRLQATSAEHMLYATRLAEDLVLAMVFDAETPFNTIRSQATRLVRSLAASPQPSAGGDEEDAELDEDVHIAGFTDILSNIPSPNPDVSARPVVGISPMIGTPGTMPQAATFSRETSPAVRVETDEDLAPTRKTVIEYIDPLAVTRKTRAQKKKEPAAAPGTEERSSRSASEVARKIVLEPTTSSVYNLNYACLLIPRFTHHHLVGDVADRLGEWVPQICVAFGWRLEQISVRPDYLQWIVNVPPATSPGYLMRILRQHTSEKIFGEFARFKGENPSGDFWAPGYLIMGGTNPPPAQLVKEFIAQTRQRQGVSQQPR